MTYRRLVSVNGAVPGDLAKRDAEQKRKEREWEANRKREGEDAREARLRKEAEEDRREQAVVDELTSIYDFRMTGRDVIDGRSAIVFTFDPRPGYVPGRRGPDHQSLPRDKAGSTNRTTNWSG